jgi:hypothetical protein
MHDTTVIDFDISEDGKMHYHYGLLKDYIPETLPYDLRINKDGNMPQLRFNNDGHRPKPTKSAGKHNKAPAAPSAAANDDTEPVLLLQKAQHDEAGSSQVTVSAVDRHGNVGRGWPADRELVGVHGQLMVLAGGGLNALSGRRCCVSYCVGHQPTDIVVMV